MNQLNTPSSSGGSFDSRDFRLHYCDLHQPMYAPEQKKSQLAPTPEFPFLADNVCAFLVEVATRQRLSDMGVDPERSNVGLQGWAERYCRNAQMQGWVAPDHWLPRKVFRLRVFLRTLRSVRDFVVDQHL